MSIARKPIPKIAAPADKAVEAAVETNAASMNDAMHAAGETLRSSVEKGVAQTRAAYDQAKDAAQKNSAALETSFDAVKSGVAAINEKSLDAVKSFFDAQVAFAKSALGAKTFADFSSLQGDFARKQIEALTAVGKDFGAHAQKVAADAIEPIKARMDHAFHAAA